MYQFNRCLKPKSFPLRVIISYMIIHITVAARAASQYDLDMDSGTPRMILRAGYSAESHFVTTEDGYIIEIHRIPGRVGSIPVFLQHGLFGSSNTWVLTGKNHSLAYRLADEGYDVWMGNIRGNTFGKAHMNMSIDDKQFYNFCIDDLGMYDLTAEILYVTNLTSESVILIPFSMGSPMSLIMASQRLEMQSKIRVMIHLAPAVFVYHIKMVVARYGLPFFMWIGKSIFDLLGIREMIPGSWILRILDKYLCGLTDIQSAICREIVMFFTGYDRAQFPLDLVPIMLNYVPDTTSLNVIHQYGQWVQTGYFRPYDQGETKNLEIYNRSTPPDYDIGKVKIPNVVFYGDNDVFVVPEDVLRLYDLFPNKAGIFRVNYSDFTHLDFRFATDAPTLVYDDVMKIMKDYH